MNKLKVLLLMCLISTMSVYARNWNIFKRYADAQYAQIAQKAKTQFNTLVEKLVVAQCPEATASAYPELFALFSQVTARANMGMPRMFVIKRNSRHSAIMCIELGMSVECNAMAYSLDEKNPLVFLDADLLTLFTPTELTGVIAHELSHVIYGHGQKTVQASVVMMSVTTFVALALRMVEFLPSEPQDLRWRAFKYVALGGGMSIAAAIYWFVRLKRYFEKQADCLATKLIQNKEWINAINKLDVERAKRYPYTEYVRAKVAPWIGWAESHPSFEQRKQYIEKEVFDGTACGA